MVKASKGKAKKKKLSSEEKRVLKLKNEHRNFARSLFRQAGFLRLSAAAEKEFDYKNVTSDFDDMFLLENVLVVCEYTTSDESHVSAHLKKKSFLYAAIAADPAEFIEFVKTNFPDTKGAFLAKYADLHYQVRIVYASRYPIKSETKELIKDVYYLDYAFLRYFASVAATVKLSSRYELLDFLNIKPGQYSNAAVATSSSSGGSYSGSVLPETYSHFPKGYKIVSFYVDAGALLSRAYVLRKNGWREGSEVYQRMISPQKVESIRRYLLGKNVSFVNNIIVTLPADTKLLDGKSNTIDVAKIVKTEPGTILLPAAFNSIGLIDGQHRVFSYYEGGANEEAMAVLRGQQNLLVTGIMYPPLLGEAERTRVAARLFLEINSNQTNAKTDLKQEINLILKPYDTDSIAKKVLNGLNMKGPLEDVFERYFFDKYKLKTTTIVSYGLRPLVRLADDGPLFSKWAGSSKEKVKEGKDDVELANYIAYCVSELNLFLAASKSLIGKAVGQVIQRLPIKC